MLTAASVAKLSLRTLPTLGLLLAGCLTPLADPNNNGPDISAFFEIKGGADTSQSSPDALSDAAPDGAQAGPDATAEDVAQDVSLTDAVALADATTGDTALSDAATATDIADGDTATSLPDATTAAEVWQACGDGKCSKADKENCKVCPADCGDCPSYCGDNVCDSDESCALCPADCGSCTPACSLFGSSGCQLGEQCFPDGKANFCAASGAGFAGGSCTYFNDCQPNLLCIGGQCRAICDATAADSQWLCKPGIACDKVNVSGNAAAKLGVCEL